MSVYSELAVKLLYYCPDLLGTVLKLLPLGQSRKEKRSTTAMVCMSIDKWHNYMKFRFVHIYSEHLYIHVCRM